jgi:hypothetical protein
VIITFVVLFKDILAKQAKEETKEINLKLILLKEFYKCLNVFLKQAIDKLLPHRYVDYYIMLEGNLKLGHVLLYNMS